MREMVDTKIVLKGALALWVTDCKGRDEEVEWGRGRTSESRLESSIPRGLQWVWVEGRPESRRSFISSFYFMTISSMGLGKFLSRLERCSLVLTGCSLRPCFFSSYWGGVSLWKRERGIFPGGQNFTRVEATLEGKMWTSARGPSDSLEPDVMMPSPDTGRLQDSEGILLPV